MKILREEVRFGILYDTDTLRFSLVPPGDSSEHGIFIPLTERPIRDDIPSAPVRVYVELTRRCNLTCRHCFVGSSPTASEGLSTDRWLELIDHLRGARVIDVRFTGGEVTTRSDWFRVLAAARAAGFIVSLNTNGVYADPQRIVSQIASLDLHQVTVSLDGLAAIHDEIRGKGTFDATVDALARLRTAGVKTRVNCVLATFNVRDVSKLLDYVAPYVEEINFFYMRPVGRALRLREHMLQYEEYAASTMQAPELRSRYPHIRILHQEQAISDRALVRPDIAAPTVEHLPSCVTTMNISCDGRYWPHGYNTYQHPALSFGCFPQDGLQQAWLTSARADDFRGWQSELLTRCKRCSLFGRSCPGANIEMELAAQLGVIPANPYCVSAEAAPIYAKILQV